MSHVRTLPALASTAVLLLASSACASERDSEPLTPAINLRDSAGIEIVESLRPRWKDGEAWTVVREPSVRIGTVDGDEHYLLTGVVGITQLGDGRIAIALSGTNEIRFFDVAGRHLNTVGRRGQGPGEFSKLSYLARFRGDSLVAFDGARNRLTIFDGEGRFARTGQVHVSGDLAAGPRGVFDDGTMLVSWGIEESERQRQREAAPPTNEPGVGMSRFATIATDGSRITDLGSRASGRRPLSFGRGKPYAELMDEFQRGGTARGATLYMAAPQIYHAVGSRTFWRADASGFEILAHSPIGVLSRIIRRPHERELIPASAKVDTATLTTVSSVGSASTRGVLRPESIVWPERYPSFDDLRADRAGNLWVKHYPRAGAANTSVSWSVFDSTGALLGDVVTPGGIQLFEIGETHILGVVRDSVDVEQVRLYPIMKRRN